MNKKNHNQFVRCVKNIQDLSGQGFYEYVMILDGGLCGSRKTIKYNPKTKKYSVKSHIDGSRFIVTEKQLLNPKLSMLGEAMRKRSLIVEID